jgi:membrane associated rhomboid family serine protease
MIIPWLSGFLRWSQAPLTWTLIAVNGFIFLLTYQPEGRSRHGNNAGVDKLFSTQEELVLTGRLYDQFQFQRSPAADDVWNQQKLKSKDQYLLLGSQALRDPEFMRAAQDYKFSGDEVAVQDWKKSLDKFQDHMKFRSSYLFGLLPQERRPLTWITYQFMHAGLMHLFSNMILLLIFAGTLESLIGGAGVALVYLASGIAGGIGFFILSSHSTAPMVGASGALSGIMACYAAFEKKRRVPFFYFLSPIKGYYGLIYLPTLLIFLLCFLTDIASFLGTPAELGAGIAYTAHIGGAIFGGIVGLVLRYFGFRNPDREGQALL